MVCVKVATLLTYLSDVHVGSCDILLVLKAKFTCLGGGIMHTVRTK